jgi:hypothetical protein
MRKLLLASAALLGAAGVAQAQVTMNPQPNTAMTGFANLAAAPAPGQVVVRLNGAFLWYGAFNADGDANALYFVDSRTNPTGARWFSSGSFSLPVAAKLNQGFSMGSYIRLYPGFDGVAANGLRYGAAAEIRQESGGRAAGGAFSPGGAGGQNTARATLYWRRAYGYFGMPELGTIRVGSIDGPSNLLSTGKNYFNDAGWNGDLPLFKANNVGPAWPFMDVGNLYIINKLIYLSPAWNIGVGQFDFGLSYAPNNNTLSAQNGCALGMASVGCDRLASITSNGNTNEQRRHRDWVEAFARLRGSSGGFGYSMFGGYIGSGKIHSNFVNPVSGAPSPQTLYDGISIGLGGVQVSYAGFALGGMIQGGNMNLGYALKPTGAPDSLAWYVSGTYTNGPMIVGLSYFEHTYAGAFVPAWQVGGTPGVGRERKDRGFAAGGTYAVAPGFAVYLSYLWGDRYQFGVNQLTGETVTTGSGGGLAGLFKNRTTVQAVSIGTAFRW